MAYSPWEYQSPDDYRDQVLDAEEAERQRLEEDADDAVPPPADPGRTVRIPVQSMASLVFGEVV